jgi:ferredoxin
MRPGTIAAMSTFTISLEPAGWTFEAAPGSTVLQAAEQAGIELPSSCRNGTCRTCLCRMRQGSVDYLVEWPGLSADEKRGGDILPCVAVPRDNLVLEQRLAKRLWPD